MRTWFIKYVNWSKLEFRNVIINVLFGEDRNPLGEHIRIKIMKEGEGQGQGIGYLDDGTMVVVENGTEQIGKEVDTIVTSVLQNSAGRMIFSKLYDGRAS